MTMVLILNHSSLTLLQMCALAVRGKLLRPKLSISLLMTEMLIPDFYSSKHIQ